MDRAETNPTRGARLVFDLAERERTRLARALHDGVSQTLTACLLTMEFADSDDSDPSERRESIARLRIAIGEIRALTQNLRPPLLESGDLFDAIETWLDSRRSDGAFGYRLRRDPAAPPLSNDTATVVYRIAQTAVETAAAFADRSPIDIALAADAGVLRVAVAADATLDRTGIAALSRAREALSVLTAMLDGRCDLDPLPEGRGFALRIELPVPRAGSRADQ